MRAVKKNAKREFNPAPLLISLALIIGTLACYWQVRHFQFISTDDPVYLTDNPMVQLGLTWSGIVWAFKSGYASNWHPLTWLSHMLDASLYGPDAGGHHFTNVLFHAANALLLFLLLRKMTGATWRSAFVAALFAWHPGHVESVAWVAERKDVLSTFFLMLTLLTYAAYCERSNRKNAKSKIYCVIALVFFAFGLMSKPMLVTTPFLMLLLDYWPLGRIADFGLRIADCKKKEARLQCRPIRFLIWEKVPFFILAAAVCVVTFLVQSKAGSVMSTERMPLGLRMENVLVTYAIYLGRLFWPANLALFYPYPQSIPVWQYAGAAILLLGMSVLAAKFGKKYRWLPVGWFWFLGTLVPVIGIVQVGIQSRADRYTYIPYIGLGIVIAWGGDVLIAFRPKWKPVFGTAGVLGLGVCLVLTQKQASYWRTSFSLFEHAVEAVPESYMAHVNLGTSYAMQGQMEAAETHFKKAIELNPAREENGHYNLGHVYDKEGKLDLAANEYMESIKVAPEPQKYQDLATVYLREYKINDAIAMFKKAVEFDPGFEPGHFNLAMAYLVLEKTNEAIAEFNIATNLAPRDTVLQQRLADTLAGRTDPAVLKFRAEAEQGGQLSAKTSP